MRQFSNKEKEGFARALQTFMRCINGQKANVNTYAALLDKALEKGLTIDEILNRGNYVRVSHKIQSPSAEDYINVLVGGEVEIKPLRQDAGWDDVEQLKIIAEAFHDFFTVLLPKGGTYSTPKALDNLRKVILRYGLQTVMCEEYIEKHKKTFPEDKMQTFYQYIVNILQNAEDIGVCLFSENLTEEQAARAAEQTDCHSVKEVDPTDLTNEEKAEADKVSGDRFNDPDNETELNTETADENGDTVEEPEEMRFEEVPSEDDPYLTSTFQVNINPVDFKAQNIHDIIIGYTLEEIQAIAECVPNAKTLQDIINSLAKGEYDKTKETIEARQIHQNMNTDLIRPFVECVRIEGVEMDDDQAARYDVLLDDWDLRDVQTRKKDKLKNLIYHALEEKEDDPDLLSAIEDIEKLYSKE